MKSMTTCVLAGLLVFGSGGFSAGSSPAANYQLKFGVQTWTLRNLEFDQVVAFAVKHNIKYLEMIGKHMDPYAPPEETMRKKAILDKNGLVCYTFGVNGTSTDKGKNRQLFEFAKLMGISLIIVEPRDMKEWDNLEELVKEYNIRLAIHNHGLKTTYGNPDTVKRVLAQRDKRIGVCLDVGWVTAAGFDAAQVFKEYQGRVFDVHVKDKTVEKKDGQEVVRDVVLGTGETNLKGLFQAMQAENWDGVLALETDQNLQDPTDYVLHAMKFVQENQP
jgi:sugar phosphate isomerase/epimerase